ncbi:hypothetical protein RHM58_25115 [Pseudomonas sp. 10S4]|nr:hypothetical protein [Pseudomonas sp. 10S4]WPX17171.1 hypothetical protein RHM58_25115 [Pseudomonas sp. 10S4]
MFGGEADVESIFDLVTLFVFGVADRENSNAVTFAWGWLQRMKSRILEWNVRTMRPVTSSVRVTPQSAKTSASLRLKSFLDSRVKVTTAILSLGMPKYLCNTSRRSTIVVDFPLPAPATMQVEGSLEKIIFH